MSFFKNHHKYRISFRLLDEMDEKERRSQIELDVKSLQILRAIIHNEIMHSDPNLKEDNPPLFRKLVGVACDGVLTL